MIRPDDINSKAAAADPPPPMAGTHFDDQAERYPIQAPEDFPRGTGLGGHVEIDGKPYDKPSADSEANILPSDSPGG
jgi:hypothetical protein